MSLDVSRPEFRPDPTADRETMECLQVEIAETARFADDLGVDPADLGGSDEGDDRRADEGDDRRADDGDGRRSDDASGDRSDGPPVVAAVDQAFLDGRAVGAAVAVRAGTGETVARNHAVTDLEIPYVPGLLAFREGAPAIAALAGLDADPGVVLVDGSGRIHFREAGLATHLGVVFDVPTVGVAKSLLCGTPAAPVEDLPAGRRVPVRADADVTAPDGTVIGHAVQTRQFDSPNRSINPVYVSPGHRVGADTAADLVLGACDRYKLPEPIRRADRYADERTRALDGD